MGDPRLRPSACLEQLIDTIALMDYDVVCYDVPDEWLAVALPFRLATD